MPHGVNKRSSSTGPHEALSRPHHVNRREIFKKHQQAQKPTTRDYIWVGLSVVVVITSLALSAYLGAKTKLAKQFS